MTKPIRIVRARHDDKYFASSRVTPQDRTLSWDARGVLWYLLSKSDNWELQPSDLQQGCGRDKVYKLLNELIEHRYIERIEERDKQQKFVGLVYRVYELPYPEKPYPAETAIDTTSQGEVLPENPRKSQKPRPEKPDTANTHIRYNREEQITESALKDSGAPAQMPPPRAANPMYDAILKVWKYTAAINGLMAKMLSGTATRAGWKEYNLAEPIAPADLLAWAAWYRKTALGGDERLNMLEDRMKIQSSITYWREKRAHKLEDAERREAADREWQESHPELFNNPLLRTAATVQR